MLSLRPFTHGFEHMQTARRAIRLQMCLLLTKSTLKILVVSAELSHQCTLACEFGNMQLDEPG